MVLLHDVANRVGPVYVRTEIPIALFNLVRQPRPLLFNIAQQVEHIVVTLADGHRNILLPEGEECSQIDGVASLGGIVNIHGYDIDLVVVKLTFHQQTAQQIAYSDLRRQTFEAVVNEVECHSVCEKAMLPCNIES